MIALECTVIEDIISVQKPVEELVWIPEKKVVNGPATAPRPVEVKRPAPPAVPAAKVEVPQAPVREKLAIVSKIPDAGQNELLPLRVRPS